MPKFDKRALERLEELIDFGHTLANHPVWGEVSGWYISDAAELSQWITSSLNFISRVIGGETQHYRMFDEQAPEALQGNLEAAQRCLGVLKAVKADITSSFLFERELLISADVFDDFLEQAEHLLESKYKDAAAVLIGSVLESTLRKMCKKHGVDVTDKTGAIITDTATIAPLNDALYKGKVYSKLLHKQIIVWADIRNNAAHGHYEKYTQSNVEDMDKWIRSFVTEHLA